MIENEQDNIVAELGINKEYELSENNVLTTEPANKEQITLCDTKRKGFGHFDYWKNRMDGRYKSTTPFTVDKQGNIYQHYSSYYTPYILGNKILDSRNIYISLVNEGWVVERNGKYLNWIGEELEEEPFQCDWRGYELWNPYTPEQFHSVIKLCEYLFNEHNIRREVMRSNIPFNYVEDFKGIAYKSNYQTMYKDLNPAWFFRDFKKKIEKNEKKREKHSS